MKPAVLISAHIRWFNAEAEYAFRLARGLERRGVPVIVWGLSGSPLLKTCEKEGLSVIGSESPGSLNPLAAKKAMLVFSRIVERAGIKILNAHRSEGFPLLALAARKRGLFVVRTRGDMRPPKLSAVNRVVYERWTDLVIAGNDLIREELVTRLGLPETKVRTVRLGINPQEVTPREEPELSRRRLGIPDGAPVVGVMGRIGPVKGQEFLLKAADKVRGELPETRFLVIYRDIEREDKFLPMLRNSPHRPSFIFVGPGRGHVEAMQVAQVAVIPSVGSEAHCRVALEWMAMRKPVIGSRVGVIPEVIDHGTTGFLVQPRYAHALAECMLALLKNPGRAELMGEAGYRRLLSRFTEEKMVEDTMAAFKAGHAPL